MSIEKNSPKSYQKLSFELEGIISNLELAKAYLLQDRLKISLEETLKFINCIKNRIAKELNTIPQAIELDFNFKGKNINLIITIDRQNLDLKQNK